MNFRITDKIKNNLSTLFLNFHKLSTCNVIYNINKNIPINNIFNFNSLKNISNTLILNMLKMFIIIDIIEKRYLSGCLLTTAYEYLL